MNASAAATAAALCLVALAGCTEGFATVHSAAWESGNTFSYTIEAASEVHVHLAVEGGDKEDIDETDSEGPAPWIAYQVVNTQLRHGDEPMYLTLSNVDNAFVLAALGQAGIFGELEGTLTTPLGFRQRDLQPMQTTSTGDRVSFSNDGDDYSWIRFPLKAGDSWSGVVGADEEDGEPGVRISSSVGGLAEVDGPGGKVEAIRIHHVARPAQDLEAEIRAEAKEDGVEIRSLEASMTLTADLYFAPELRNVVLQRTTASFRLAAEFVEDGKRGEVDVREESTVTLRLAAAVLAAEGEVPVGDLDDLIDDGVPLPEPGTVVPPSNAGPHVVASPAFVNVAEPEDTTFRLDATSAAGTDFHYVLLQAGEVLAEGRDSSFTHRFDQPGMYHVIFEGKDAQGEPFAASADYAAVYVAPATLSCGDVHVDGVTTCDEARFPVGLSPATVTITVDSFGLHPLAELAILDAEGLEAARGPFADGELEAQRPDGAAVGDWSVAADALAAVITQAQLVVSVVPSGAGDLDASGTDTWAGLPSWLSRPAQQAHAPLARTQATVGLAPVTLA